MCVTFVAPMHICARQPKHPMRINPKPNTPGLHKSMLIIVCTVLMLSMQINAQLQPPQFSHLSGFYDSSFALTITHPDSSVEIIYTLNGAQPSRAHLNGKTFRYKNSYPELPGQLPDTIPMLSRTYHSFHYQAPVLIYDRSIDSNDISQISTTFHHQHEPPQFLIPKAFVVKARAYLGNDSSEVVTRTYFVNANNSHQYTIPVISMSVNEEDFFDYDTGIYVAGQDFDQWRLEYPQRQTAGHNRANWRRRGRDYEKPAYFQYFKDGYEVLSQNIGVRIHGGWSRSYVQKTLRLYARNAYDAQNSFDHNFFGEPDSYKRLLLRNSGQDFRRTMFRDAFIQELVSHHLPTQSYRPTILYLNGSYWGIHNIRTRFDKHFFDRVFGIDEEDLDYLNLADSAKEGTNEHYLKLLGIADTADFSNDETLSTLDTMMDIDNYTDFMIIQAFINNQDWRGNIDYFRKRTEKYTPDAPFGQDGRWRWLLFDTDFGFGLYQGHQFDMIAHIQEDNTEENEKKTRLIRNLLKNDAFRQHFILRFCDIINTTFTKERMLQIMEDMGEVIEPYIEEHRERYDLSGNHNWTDHLNAMKHFINRRAESQWGHLQSHFNTGDAVRVRLDVSSEDHGYIRINTIDINPETIGVNGYPWEGVYFADVPITLTAEPMDGYRLDRWSGDVNSEEASITVYPREAKNIKAYFTRIEEPHVIHNWFFGTDLPNNTPLKVLETTYSVSPLHGQLTFQSAFTGYPYNRNHSRWRRASMERRNRPTDVNYFPKANNHLSFEDANMRGIQIRQPFVTSEGHSKLFFDFSTREFADVKLTLAVENEADIEALKFSYKLGDSYSTHQLADSLIALFDSGSYKRITVDFSNVEASINADTFSVCVEFVGENLFDDLGKRININNVAVIATPEHVVNTYLEFFTDANDAYEALMFPNPTTGQLRVLTKEKMAKIEVYNMQGQKIYENEPSRYDDLSDVSHLASGKYVVVVFYADGNRYQQPIIKY